MSIEKRTPVLNHAKQVLKDFDRIQRYSCGDYAELRKKKYAAKPDYYTDDSGKLKFCTENQMLFADHYCHAVLVAVDQLENDQRYILMHRYLTRPIVQALQIMADLNLTTSKYQTRQRNALYNFAVNCSLIPEV